MVHRVLNYCVKPRGSIKGGSDPHTVALTLSQNNMVLSKTSSRLSWLLVYSLHVFFKNFSSTYSGPRAVWLLLWGSCANVELWKKTSLQVKSFNQIPSLHSWNDRRPWEEMKRGAKRLEEEKSEPMCCTVCVWKLPLFIFWASTLFAGLPQSTQQNLLRAACVVLSRGE